MTQRITVYAGGFGTANPTDAEIQSMVATANALADSDFTVILLSFLNVDENDVITYPGNFPEVDPGTTTPVFSQLATIFQLMKSATTMSYTNGKIVAEKSTGKPAKKLLFSIGGWANAQSYFRIYAPTSQSTPLYSKFKTIADHYFIDGYDFDYEPLEYNATLKQVWETLPNYYSPPTPNNQKGINTQLPGFDTTYDYTMMADIVNGFYAQDSSWLLTAAPYEEASWWGLVIQNTSHFSWLNVQFYVGTPTGADNTPPTNWPTNLDSWIQATGLPANQLDPGPDANPSSTPVFTASTIQTALQDTTAKGYNVQGAFVWNYHWIESDAEAWATAMKNGLSAPVPA